ncbi:MAG: cytochrome c maturation protein CcmE [Candidatus Marinimicrobia bacterium]|nr:cytochrome c maturation protein CcmE [Candidatus Neomarinimicrobiota bacterium]MBT3630367.1 cytochrome c maturation protein CcmE [Candidatus Neomarinimicrobiota bacterium]MBT3823687.1 cytochrome c maturation protein CcmE [Candidatus Neomarinimicrobiota bacterium]MBT4131965.1 cytochrome c maturation protein CcmE [Candidatus Neomarinimicrobiota bacterium]MBT4294690.1 cytochrome c maturation protein CcmE [Candidatus Neomarinimicrobiota bacterium]
MNNNKLKFVIGSLVIIAAVIVLAIQGMQEDTTMSYSKSVSEVQLLGSRAYAMTLKVNGDLKKGSIIRNNLDLDFVITEGNSELSIHYIGKDPIPDTFNNEMDAEVIVSGKLQKDGIFHAERIQAKCASKYEADYSSPEI